MTVSMLKKIPLENLINDDLIQLPDPVWEGSLRNGAGKGPKSKGIGRVIVGVYVLEYEGEVIYVGLSNNVEGRLRTHYNPKVNALHAKLRQDYGNKGALTVRSKVRATIYEIPHRALSMMVEGYLIYRYRPKYNAESLDSAQHKIPYVY